MVTKKKFKVGDKVGWNSEAGHVTGVITGVHRKPFLVNGYMHHATADDPQYTIRSLKSKHVAHHKASALHRI